MKPLLTFICGAALMYGVQDFNSVEAEERTLVIHTQQDVCGYDDIGLVRPSLEDIKHLTKEK